MPFGSQSSSFFAEECDAKYANKYDGTIMVHDAEDFFSCTL